MLDNMCRAFFFLFFSISFSSIFQCYSGYTGEQDAASGDLRCRDTVSADPGKISVEKESISRTPSTKLPSHTCNRCCDRGPSFSWTSQTQVVSQKTHGSLARNSRFSSVSMGSKTIPIRKKVCIGSKFDCSLISY